MIVGEWECSDDGVWKFVMEQNCVAQCVMVADGITYSALKSLIEQEFQTEVEGVVRRLSYCPPSEMCMFSSGKTPPVSINSDRGVNTFFQVRAATKAIYLLVSFGIKDVSEDVGRTGNVMGSGECMIRLDDGTPSLGSGGVRGESYDAVNKGYPVMTDASATVNAVVSEQEVTSCGIDLNSIYDAEMVAQLEIFEAMAKEAQGLTSRKGKEKAPFGGNVREGLTESENWDLYRSREEEEEEFNYWNALVSREYRVMQDGTTLERGETSNAGGLVSSQEHDGVRLVSLPDSGAEGFETEKDLPAVIRNGFPGVALPEEECVIGDALVEEDSEVEEAMQLSLANIYNETIEGDVVPSHDCNPCFGDEYLQTQDVQNGVFDPTNDAIFIGRVFRNKA